MRGNQKGFSLIELIIVIAIMAVLVAIIAPNLTKYLGQSKQKVDNSNADTIKKVLEQTCALTNTEVCEPAVTGTWVEIQEDSAYFDSDAVNVNGYIAFARYVAETLEEVPKSKVTGNHFEAKITYDSTRCTYSVEVRVKS